MKIILTHIMRNIKEKKGRSILIIISLMIASITFILNLTIPNQIVETKMQQSRKAIGSSDIMVASFDVFNIDDLKLSDEKIKSVGVNSLYLIHKDKTLVIYGTDIKKASEISLVTNIDLKDNEIIISKSTADKYNYKVNDTITLEIEDSKYELKIKDIVDAKGLLSFKTLSGVINNNTYNKISGNKENEFSMYYMDVLDDKKIDEVNTYIKDNNKKYMVEKLVDKEKIREDNYYTQFILTIIFVMATIMIFFVVNTLNKMIVMERMPVIGTFRSIGASKRKMNRLLILENSIYGLAGGLVGAIISLIINRFAASLLLGGTNINTNMPVENLVFGILFTVALEILMSITSIIKSNKYSIKEIMFEGKNSKAGFNKKEMVISIILIIISTLLYFFVNDTNVISELISLVMFWIGVAYFIPTMMVILSKIICYIARKISSGSLLMAGKNLGFNKLLISSTRLVVISTSIMLVIINISISFNSMIDSYKVQFSGYDGTIRDVSKKYYEYDLLKNVDNVKSIEYNFMYSIDNDITYNDGKTLDAGPMFLGMNKSAPSIVELDYKIKDLKDDECLFDRILLKNNNLKVGDIVDFYLKSQDKHIKVKIVGTVDSYYMSTQREIVVITDNMFRENITEVPFSIEFTVNDSSKVRDTIELMERQLKDPDITIWTIDDFCNIQRKNINSFMSLFYIIISLALVLSFVGIINNQIISFMERTKEIAVLNSVCMSKKQLRKMLVIENITSNIVACTFGFIVSIMSLRYMNKLMYGIKMYTDIQYQYIVGLIIMGIVLIVLLSTVIVPIKKMKKINVVEAIKYE